MLPKFDPLFSSSSSWFCRNKNKSTNFSNNSSNFAIIWQEYCRFQLIRYVDSCNFLSLSLLGDAFSHLPEMPSLVRKMRVFSHRLEADPLIDSSAVTYFCERFCSFLNRSPASHCGHWIVNRFLAFSHLSLYFRSAIFPLILRYSLFTFLQWDLSGRWRELLSMSGTFYEQNSALIEDFRSLSD